MKSAVVNKSSCQENNLRLDPSFHLSEGVSAKRAILDGPYGTLPCGKAAMRIFNGGRYKRIYVTNPQCGIPLISSSGILKADLSDAKLVSKKFSPEIEDRLVQRGWILISRSGTIGNTAFTNAGHAQKLASEDVIRLVPNDILRAGYLYAFLSSKYGYALLTQGTFGAVIQHIECPHVANIPVPIFPDEMQKEIDQLIRDAASLRDKAAELFDKAKSILQESIGVSFDKTNGYRTAFTSIKNIRSSLKMRLDPPVFVNDGVEMLERISDKTQPLSICNAIVRRPGIFKRCYVLDGLPYIKGSEIFNTNPFIRCENLSKLKTPMQDEMALKDGQILVTCAGSVGQVKLITKEYEDKKSIGSQDIIRIETSDSLFTPEYLFTYLSLPMTFDYMQSMKYGAVIERIEPFHVESIPVVIPTKELSATITDIISEYKDSLYMAFCKEEKAISMVETEIESWDKNKSKK